MQWSVELLAVCTLVAILGLGLVVLVGRKDSPLAKVFTFCVAGFVLSLAVYSISLNQFNDGTAAFRMAFHWIGDFLAPLIA